MVITVQSKLRPPSHAIQTHTNIQTHTRLQAGSWVRYSQPHTWREVVVYIQLIYSHLCSTKDTCEHINIGAFFRLWFDSFCWSWTSWTETGLLFVLTWVTAWLFVVEGVFMVLHVLSGPIKKGVCVCVCASLSPRCACLSWAIAVGWVLYRSPLGAQWIENKHSLIPLTVNNKVWGNCSGDF